MQSEIPISKQRVKRSLSLVTNLNDFDTIESYKVVRTNVMFSLIKDGCKRIVITSSQVAEGKTTIAVNLAVTLAQQLDIRVLLIDCDLRKPKVNLYFDLPLVPGFTDHLLSKTPIGVIYKTDIENLNVITCGSIPPNPSELLASEKAKKFLNELESHYDYIIIDSPPVNVVVDALPLIKMCDGVILVLRSGISSHINLQKTLNQLKTIDAKILGFIMNGVKETKKSYYRYKGKYGYKYGYSSYGYSSRDDKDDKANKIDHNNNDSEV